MSEVKGKGFRVNFSTLVLVGLGVAALAGFAHLALQVLDHLIPVLVILFFILTFGAIFALTGVMFVDSVTPRFSLRTLLLAACLLGSLYGLWWRWEPQAIKETRLPELWLVLAFGIGLAWSAWKDWKRLMPVWKPMDIASCPDCRNHLPRGVTSCWNTECDFQLPEYTSASGSDE